MPSLHDAIDPYTARALLAERANVHWIDANGLTPLYRAAIRNDLPLIELYLTAGARPDQCCGTSRCALDVATDPTAATTLRAAAARAHGGASLLNNSPARQTSPRNTKPPTNQKDTQSQEKLHG